MAESTRRTVFPVQSSRSSYGATPSNTGPCGATRSDEEAGVFAQTEEARFKLGGLILEIEGVGRTKPDNQPVLQALGFISFDDETSAYHMRAFNDGRFLETDVKLLEDGKSLTWGFALGSIRTSSVLRINEQGEWTELHEITIDSQPARKLMEVTVKRRE